MASPLTATPPAKDEFSSVATLPANTTLSYLAEGAANVIYRLSSPPDGPQFPNQLLRLRKALPSAQPNRLSYTQLLRTFHPLFPEQLLLPTTLIRIPASVLARENTGLKELEKSGRRPAKRHGLYLEEVKEEFGYLMTDMSPHPLPDQPGQTRQLLIEFKPKWVVQSLSAPLSWRRCRTCALRLSKAQKPNFCPLDLASCDENRVRRAAQYIVPAAKPRNLQLGAETWDTARHTITERIVKYLAESDLMSSLKNLHAKLDPYGPLAIQTLGSAERESFVTAMTIRDLTIFVRIDLDAGVDAKIGDLDLKTGDAGKWAYWSEVEVGLTEGGWYEGREEGVEEKGTWCEL